MKLSLLLRRCWLAYRMHAAAIRLGDLHRLLEMTSDADVRVQIRVAINEAERLLVVARYNYLATFPAGVRRTWKLA